MRCDALKIRPDAATDPVSSMSYSRNSTFDCLLYRKIFNGIFVNDTPYHMTFSVDNSLP